MSQLRHLRGPAFGISLLVAQVLRAGHRKDLPSLQNQDPSGVFGDETSPPLRIVVLGDSSVTSPGVTPLDACWPRRIAIRLSDRYHVELVSVAVGGAKARDVIATQIAPAIAADADIAFVSVGANDALRGTPLARLEREYRHILTELTRYIPGVAVSGIGDLGSIPRLPALVRSLVRIRGRSFDHAIRRVTFDFPDVVKTDTWSSGWEEFLTNPDQVFAADLFHASGYGHGIYARAAIPAVEVLVERHEEARWHGAPVSRRTAEWRR
jgi:lysophospholipase L1-like esterase